jgi:Trk K+ transport system NAD-binding subunit
MSSPRPRTGHFVLIGGDGLAYRLADELTRRYDADVVVLMTPEQHRIARDFAELPRVRVDVVERVNEKALIRAEAHEASGLVIAVQDDVANIHVALQARELVPTLRLVVRMYNTRLGQAIESLLGECRVLSDAEIAAPALIATTLDEVAANPVEVARRTLIVARREDVPERDVLCGLAITTNGGEPTVLPADQAQANLVLADARSARAMELVSTGQPKDLPEAKPPAWRFKAALAFVRALLNRKLGIAFFIVVLTLAVTGTVLTLGDNDIGPWEGFYLTLVNAFGGPQPTLEFTHLQQGLQLIMGFAGLALVPLLTALIVEGMVNARLAVAQGRLLQPLRNHIVLVGLGGVGTRIMRLLYDRGIQVIAIDSNENARGVPLARELAVPLIIGDASRETTLRQAGVERCRAMMAVASTDVVNLEVALQGRNLKPTLRALVRIFDGDLADRVRRTFKIRLTRSVSYVAAPAFAEALMDREVIGTIAVERRVLLIAEVIVGAGSRLDGATLGAIDEPGASRVVALTERGEPRPLWSPPQTRRVSALDTLTVVCTRDGLSDLIRQSRPSDDLVEPASVA